MHRLKISLVSAAALIATGLLAQAQRPAKEYLYDGIACDKEPHLVEYLGLMKAGKSEEIDVDAMAAINTKYKNPLACMEIQGLVVPVQKTVPNMKVRGGMGDVYRVIITRLVHNGWLARIIPYQTHIFVIPQPKEEDI